MNTMMQKHTMPLKPSSHKSRQAHMHCPEAVVHHGLSWPVREGQAPVFGNSAQKLPMFGQFVYTSIALNRLQRPNGQY